MLWLMLRASSQGTMLCFYYGHVGISGASAECLVLFRVDFTHAEHSNLAPIVLPLFADRRMANNLPFMIFSFIGHTLVYHMKIA